MKRRSGGPFEFLDQITDTFYVHTNTNLASCYVVTAIDSFDNESLNSNQDEFADLKEELNSLKEQKTKKAS